MPSILAYSEPEFHIQGWKRCTGCFAFKPMDNFSKRKGRPIGQSRCKDCNKFDRILRNYNITQADYLQMVDDQRSRCAICGELQYILCIDHDHSCCPDSSRSCGKCVRQLLCHRCNRVLGSVNDDVLLLTSMTNYVERHREN